jgi:hypothetical protein
MSPLEFVEPSGDTYVNVLLYGAPKTGKTVGAATAPGPILYLNADRPNATRFAHAHSGQEIREVKAEGLQTLIDVVGELMEKGDAYNSVVVDPVGELYRVIIEGISGRAVRPKIQEYGDTGVHLERFCRALCELPFNVVFVLHETAVKDEDTGGFERLPYTGTNNPALAAKLMSMVDIIGYTGVVAGNDGEPPKYLAQLVNGGGRKGGDRFGALGAAREINISEWVDLAHKAIQAPSEEE